jgi:hypothetical protein
MGIEKNKVYDVGEEYKNTGAIAVGQAASLSYDCGRYLFEVDYQAPNCVNATGEEMAPFRSSITAVGGDMVVAADSDVSLGVSYPEQFSNVGTSRDYFPILQKHAFFPFL